jgi:Domain of unknown function (DUF4116)
MNMIPSLQSRSLKFKYPHTKSLWDSLKESSSFSDAVCRVLMRKDVFKPVLYPLSHRKLDIPSKYSIIHHYIESDKSVCWDYVNKCGASFGLFEKIYYICYNIFHFLFCGSIRYESKKEFILLQILESIHLEDSYKEKKFLDLSYVLRLKLALQLKINPDVNFQILARQIIQKIDACHRLFSMQSKEEQSRIYPGLPPHLSHNFDYMIGLVKQDGLMLNFSPFFQKNKQIVQAAFLQNHDSLEFADASLKGNKPFMLEMIASSDRAYDFINVPLNQDLDILKALVLKNGKRLQTLPGDFKLNKELVLLSLQSPDTVFNNAIHFRADEEVMLAAYSRGCPLKFIEPSLMSNRSFVIKAIGLRGWDVYVRSHSTIKSDKEVKLIAYKKRYLKKKLHADEIERLQDECPALFQDLDFSLHLTKLNGKNFKYLSREMQINHAVILQALHDNPLLIHDIDQRLLQHKEFMLKACGVKGSLVRFVHEDLENDIDLAKIAVTQDPKSFSLLSRQIKQNSTFIKEFLLKSPQGVTYAELDYLSPEDALEVLKNDGFLYSHMPEVIKGSSDHIKAAFFSYPHVIRSIDPDILKHHPELFRLYLIYRLNPSDIRFGNIFYLPQPLSETFLEKQNPEDKPVDITLFESFVMNDECDLKMFIESLTLPKLASCGIYISSAKKLEERKKVYRDALAQMQSRITNQTPYLGTPKSDDKEALSLFYATVKYYFSEIAKVILGKEDTDPSLLTEFNRERVQILEASVVCGGGLLGQLHELFIQLSKAKSTNLSDVISDKLSQIARSKINMSNRLGDVHVSNIYKWHLYAYIGGPKIVKDHLGPDLDEFKVMVDFFTLFNPKTICKELCDDLAHDELFYELIDTYIDEQVIPKFKESNECKAQLAKTNIRFHILKEEFLELRQQFVDALSFLSFLPKETLFQALSILFRAGSEIAIFRTLDMYLAKKLPSHDIHALFAKKSELEPIYVKLSELGKLVGKSKDELIHLKTEQLDHLYLMNLEKHKDEAANIVFADKYRTKESTLNPLGMLLVLSEMKFFEKIEAP